MKKLFIEKEMSYDGSQLKHLFAYMNFKILGDSVVAWVGPCNVLREFMADGEDLLANQEIRGDKMVHFIIQKFDVDFFAGVSLQRLITSMAVDVLTELSPESSITRQLRRDGDDIFFENNKFSISIAKKLVNSVIIHFAVNVTNSGTPVPTLALEDLNVTPEKFARELLNKITNEVESIKDATFKVIE